MPQLKIGGLCRHGHELTGDNIGWRAGKMEGTKYILCMECKRAKDRKYATKPTVVSHRKRVRDRRTPEQQERVNEAQRIARARARLTREQFKAWEADIVAKWQKDQARASSPWNLLKPKASSQDALDALNEAMETERSKCFDAPDEYIDYDEENPPSVEEAAAMCSGCPMLLLCREYGSVSKEFGVWGGIRSDGTKQFV